MNRFPLFRRHTGIIMLCVLFVGAGLLRLNDLSLYNPDSSRYLIWGNSLAHGKGFVDFTQPEPDRYVVHAPLYPILVAPIELVFPLSLMAAKVWTLLWGVLAIVLFYILLSRTVNSTMALVGAIIFAASPLVLVYSSEVLSEAPFLVFLLAALLLAERRTMHDENSRVHTVLLVLSIVAVALLREVGVTLVLAATVFFLQQRQTRLAGTTVVSAAAVLALWYVRNRFLIGPLPASQGGNFMLISQHFVTPPESSLTTELAVRLWVNFNEYAFQLAGMLMYPLFVSKQFRLNVDPSAFHQAVALFMRSWGKFVVAAIAVPLIVSGIVIDVRQSRTGLLKLFFVILYLGSILLYPVHDVRFLLPLLPFTIYYCVVAIGSIVQRRTEAGRAWSATALVSAVVVFMLPNLSSIYEILKINRAYCASPVGFYEKVRTLRTYPLMFTQPWSLMGEWICNNLPDSAVLASPSKELSIVVGDRKVLELDQNSALPTFESLLRDNRVDYLLTTTRMQNFKVYEFHMLESRRFAFEPVHSIANLHLFRVRSRLRDHVDATSAQLPASDSMDATFYLKKGRTALVQGQYEAASRFFAQSLALDSTMPEIYYQAIVALAMGGDSTRAKLLYEKLFTLPQALAYVGNARFQLLAAGLLASARTQTFKASKAVKMREAAALYWQLGYPNRAASIMDETLDADSTYFVGLLWGLHYHLQLGDTMKARRYLSILEGIDRQEDPDRSYPIVDAFRNVLLVGDSLNASRDPVERSRHHASLSTLYKALDLREEAIDEAERALGENPQNTKVLIQLAELFEGKSKYRRAEHYYREALRLEPGHQYARAKADSLGRIVSLQ